MFDKLKYADRFKETVVDRLHFMMLCQSLSHEIDARHSLFLEYVVTVVLVLAILAFNASAESYRQINTGSYVLTVAMISPLFT